MIPTQAHAMNEQIKDDHSTANTTPPKEKPPYIASFIDLNTDRGRRPCDWLIAPGNGWEPVTVSIISRNANSNKCKKHPPRIVDAFFLIDQADRDRYTVKILWGVKNGRIYLVIKKVLYFPTFP